jgi:asparagine synthase (glutamine-hydrolysing)
MSGIIAVVEPRHEPIGDTSVARMLAALSDRGDRSEVMRRDDAVLAVARFEWEMQDGLSGHALVVTDGDITVAADATLYYCDDLLRALSGAGVRPAGTTPAHMIAAAYRAWGDECAGKLEGDFAFVIRDHASRRTIAVRDFMGRRPLYYAEVGNALIIASTVGAIVAHPACPKDLDLLALGEIVGVSLAGHSLTPYAAVKALPPATALMREDNRVAQTHTYWEPRLDGDASRDTESFDSASEQLRALLSTAITERCARSSATAIWLSGGYDSPVMFAVGNAALDRSASQRLHPISFSYPVGDPGREDELIDEIARFWNARPTWLSIEDVPLLRDATAHAARSDVPFQHAFENWLRALFGATQLNGAHVALYGDGGDQLFAVSTIFLQDLFAGFRWRELQREWRAFGGSGVRELWRSVARPVLADARRRVHAPSITFPEWMSAEFVRRHGLERRQAEAEASLASGGGGRAAAETRRSLANPTIPRVLAGLSALSLEYSVELRAPLLDRRVVEFALQRPRAERASAGAVKHLLRRTSQGLLPPTVLAPRAQRTGVLTGYFSRSFRSDPNEIVSDTFAHSILAAAGIVDGAALQQSWREYKNHGTGGGGHLFVAFQTELWLKARLLTAV